MASNPSLFLRLRNTQSASFSFWAGAQTAMHPATFFANDPPSLARQSGSRLGTTKLRSVFAVSVSFKTHDFSNTP